MKTISQKILAGGLALLVLTATVAGIGIWAISRLNGEIAAANRTQSLVQAQMAADMMHDALRGDVLAALLAQNPASGISAEEVSAELKEHAASFREEVQAMGRIEASPEVSAAIKEIDAPLAAYIQAAESLVQTSAAAPADAWAQLPRFMESFGVLEDGMGALSEKIGASAKASADHAQKAGVQLQLVMIGLLMFSVVVAGVLIWLARRLVSRPITAMTSAMEKLAAGDLSAAIAGQARRDEIGAMARAVNVFRENALSLEAANAERALLESQTSEDRRKAETDQRAKAEEQRRVVDSLASALGKLSDGDLSSRINDAFPDSYEQLREDFNAAMGQLETAMSGVLGGVHGIKTGAGEIASAANDLSRRTEQQAASLEETAAALEQITATVKKTATGADQANAAVGGARVEAENSGHVVREAVAAMGQIEESSRQISQIIGVIDEIAFQTNLLALNAGVEAARAGDAGKGFAVVASEVRALAQRSAEAAKEIKALISASSEQVGLGVDLVGRTGKALNGIVTKVADISELVNEITASAREQASALAEVNTAINQMDQVTQQNAAMVEQSTAASVGLAREADDLSGLVGRFRTASSAQLAASARPLARVPSSPAPEPAQRHAAPALKPTAQTAPVEDGWEEF